MERLAKAVKAARLRRGLSQKELAETSGISQSRISKIESRAPDTRVSSMTALAQALGMEVVMVPAQALPAVRAIAKNLEADQAANPKIRREFGKLEAAAEASAEHDFKDNIIGRVHKLRQFRSRIVDLDTLRKARKLTESAVSSGSSEVAKSAMLQLDALVKQIDQSQALAEGQKADFDPLYTLSETDD